MTLKKPEELVPLAKSWLHPPEMLVDTGEVIYEPAERAYLIKKIQCECEGANDEQPSDPDLGRQVEMQSWDYWMATTEIEHKKTRKKHGVQSQHLQSTRVIVMKSHEHDGNICKQDQQPYCRI